MTASHAAPVVDHIALDDPRIEAYMRRPYDVWIRYDEDAAGNSGWVAGVSEFPGCLTQADSEADAAELIDEAMRLWIAGRLERGLPVPAIRS